MRGIRIGRWIGGGLAAGVVMWLLEGLANLLYAADVQAALDAHNLTVTMSGAAMATSLAVSCLLGIVLVFFYAAARPRFGAGPTTAVIVAVALWAGGPLLALVGYGMLGLFPSHLLLVWAVLALAELIVAALVGGWIYREV